MASKKSKKNSIRSFLGTASLFRRFLAFVADLFIINFFIVLPFRPLFTRYFGNRQTFSAMMDFIKNNPEAMAKISQVLLIVSALALLYFAVMEWRLGRTFGQMLLGIYVVSEEKKFSIWQSFVSNMFIIPFFPFFLLWIIDPFYMMLNKDGKRLSERWAKVKVMQQHYYR